MHKFLRYFARLFQRAEAMVQSIIGLVNAKSDYFFPRRRDLCSASIFNCPKSSDDGPLGARIPVSQWLTADLWTPTRAARPSWSSFRVSRINITSSGEIILGIVSSMWYRVHFSPIKYKGTTGVISRYLCGPPAPLG